MSKQLIWILLVVLFSSALVFAQSEIGGATLNGVVTDPSSAVVAGAKITVRNAAIGLTRSMETTNAGLYSFSRLPAGTYDLTVESPGFKTIAQKDIQLTVGAVVTMDTRLEVGGIARIGPGGHIDRA